MASITDGWQSVDMDFWRVEVPPGKLTTCHLGKKYYLPISQFEKKRKSSFKVEVTPAGKKIRSATVMGTSQGNQSHADYWESLIAAGKSTEKESLEARSLHAPPACPSQQAQRPGSIAEEVDTENESLHNKEKKIREVLRFDGGEKQTMPPFDNGATSFKGKSVFPNCEQCSRKFATAYALNQHNAAKHQ